MNTTPTTAFRVLIGSVALLLTGLLFIQFVGSPVDNDRQIQNRPVADAVNLALRRTAHHLLRTAGDSTSRILPVQQPGPQTFQIQLSHAFDYDQLPGLLQKSFRVYRVAGSYRVAVLDCRRAWHWLPAGGANRLIATRHCYWRNSAGNAVMFRSWMLR